MELLILFGLLLLLCILYLNPEVFSSWEGKKKSTFSGSHTVSILLGKSA